MSRTPSLRVLRFVRVISLVTVTSNRLNLQISNFNWSVTPRCDAGNMLRVHFRVGGNHWIRAAQLEWQVVSLQEPWVMVSTN